MSFLKLFNFETNRFFNIFIVLIAFTAFAQGLGLAIYLTSFMNRVNTNSGTIERYLAEYDTLFDFNYYLNTMYFFGPILVCMTVIAIYILFIWYREWFGKSTFIYRLFMLPTSRMYIFFAKLSTILLYTFALLVWQMLLIYVYQAIAKAYIPTALYVESSYYTSFLTDPLTLIIPTTLSEFILLYGFGAIIVVLIFTAILFERSFHLKGIFYGAAYAVIAFLLLFVPAIFEELFTNSLYPNEVKILTAVMGMFVIAISLFLSRYLLLKKVTV